MKSVVSTSSHFHWSSSSASVEQLPPVDVTPYVVIVLVEDPVLITSVTSHEDGGEQVAGRGEWEPLGPVVVVFSDLAIVSLLSGRISPKGFSPIAREALRPSGCTWK